MKKVALFIIGFGTFVAYAQKSKPVLQNTFVTTIVNEGTKNHFTDKVNTCDLTFTIDADAKLNGPITIKNATTMAVIFQGTMKDNYLVDSAMWYENNKLIKVANFKEKCCSSPTNYVDPTSKSLSSIKGERHGAERVYHSSNSAIKAINNYQAGKRQGKQYEYNTNKQVIAIRTYKDDKLNDTSWINCDHKTPDIEIYTAGVPSGVWKKFNSSGVQTEAKYVLPGVDSTVFYTADKKVSSILCKATAEGNFHPCTEYDAKLSMTKQYTLRDRTDSAGTWLDGMYQEFAGGKLMVSGEYSFGEKVETWTYFDKKGKEIKSETLRMRDEVIALHPETTTTAVTAPAVDLFPPSLTKATITMAFESNGKVEKMFKKVQEIKWSLNVKSNTDYKVVCTDEGLTEGERADVVAYLTSCISTVKGVRYSHKEVSFVSLYKLEFK